MRPTRGPHGEQCGVSVREIFSQCNGLPLEAGRPILGPARADTLRNSGGPGFSGVAAQARHGGSGEADFIENVACRKPDLLWRHPGVNQKIACRRPGDGLCGRFAEGTVQLGMGRKGGAEISIFGKNLYGYGHGRPDRCCLPPGTW